MSQYVIQIGSTDVVVLPFTRIEPGTDPGSGGETGDGHTHANKAILDAITFAFTTAQATKLSGIESGATADQTGAEIVAAINSQLGSEDWQTAGGGGADGASAYEIAVANGFVGDVTAWLASLQGDDGQDGSPGANGSDGADGADGANGASAYEIAVANGFVGDVTAWLASLQGDDGQDGSPGANGSDGADGVGIADVEIDLSGHLIVTLTDLSTIDAGALPTGSSEYGGTGCCSAWPYLPNQYYHVRSHKSIVNANFSSNVLYFVPFKIESVSTWNSIGLYRVPTATGNAKFGIYAAGADGLPSGDPLVSVNRSPLNYLAANREAGFSDLTLQPGLYYLAVLFATSASCHAVIVAESPFFSASDLLEGVNYFGQNANYNDPLPTVAANIVNSASHLAAPRLWLRNVV